MKPDNEDYDRVNRGEKIIMIPGICVDEMIWTHMYLYIIVAKNLKYHLSSCDYSCDIRAASVTFD